MKTPIFIHNPKCASTSIRKALPAIQTPTDNRNIHLPLTHPKVQSLIRKATEPWVFGVTRHPLERAVSAFKFFKRKHKNRMTEFWILQAVTAGMDINTFFRALDMEVIATVIPHLRPQVTFFEGGTVDQMLRQENLETDWKSLCQNLGIEEIPLGQARRHPNRDGWDKLLEQDVVDKLTHFYQEDFETFYPDIWFHAGEKAQ